MMRNAIFVFFMLPVGLVAQGALLDQVARDICACMQGVSSAEAVQKAESCLETATEDFLPEILKEYKINVSIPAERRRFGNLLIDRLADDCPILLTLELPTGEKQRWSDGMAEDRPPRYRSEKAPPPPPIDNTTGEVPSRWKFTGTIALRPVGGDLRLRDAAGDETTFELPRALLKSHRLHVGDSVAIEYRREWRKGPRKIILVVTSLKATGSGQDPLPADGQ